MQERPHVSRSLLPIGWLILAASLVPFALAAKPDLSGSYEGRAPAADAAKRVFTLSLSPDGNAMFTTRYLGKSDVVEHGRWTRQGTQVVLALDPMGPNRPPAPITFRYHGHSLIPLHWDSSEWGRAGPPVLHRAHAGPDGA
jgi:hypothetical protein